MDNFVVVSQDMSENIVNGSFFIYIISVLFRMGMTIDQEGCFHGRSVW